MQKIPTIKVNLTNRQKFSYGIDLNNKINKHDSIDIYRTLKSPLIKCKSFSCAVVKIDYMLGHKESLKNLNNSNCLVCSRTTLRFR